MAVWLTFYERAIAVSGSPLARRLSASRCWCGGTLQAAAEPDAARLRAGASLAGAGAEQFPCKLGQAAEDREQQAAVRGCGVGPGIPQRGEPGACTRDGGERVEQVARAAGEAIQLRHHQHIAGREPGIICPRRLQAYQDDCRERTKSVAMQGGCASAPPHSALSKKARPLGFSEPSPLTYA